MKRVLVSGIAVSLSILGGWAQPAGPPTFEVASMKPSPPLGSVNHSGCIGGPGSSDPGRITCENMDLRTLVMRAFNLKAYQVSGPGWITSVTYQITASVPPNATKEQVMAMWQNLLSERLKLTVHRETRELPIYALVIAKNGPKLVEAIDDPAAPAGVTNNGSASSSGSAAGASMGNAGAGAAGGGSGGGASSRRGRLTGARMPISQLVMGLTFHLDRPVIDMTGLTGRYKISLEWQDENLNGYHAASSGGPGEAPAPVSGMPEAPVAATIFAAVQEQLGLKLDARKGPIDMLVIDHAEKTPIEN